MPYLLIDVERTKDLRVYLNNSETDGYTLVAVIPEYQEYSEGVGGMVRRPTQLVLHKDQV